MGATSVTSLILRKPGSLVASLASGSSFAGAGVPVGLMRAIGWQWFPWGFHLNGWHQPREVTVTAHTDAAVRSRPSEI